MESGFLYAAMAAGTCASKAAGDWPWLHCVHAYCI